MYKNGLYYGKCTAMVLLTHLVMLAAVFLRGNYKNPAEILPVALAVIGLDIAYTSVLRLSYRQMTYTSDFLLLLLLGISMIFQSCFGFVGFAGKHFITSVLALVCCQITFLLTRNHIWIQSQKKWLYGILVILLGVTAVLPDGHWLNIAGISMQPAEFIKPVFVLLCATSIREQHNKKKILFFYISPELMLVTAAFILIAGVQWWSADLGSLPTFAGIYGCALLCRICYPKAKFSWRTVIVLSVIGAGLILAALKFAPGYVQNRLSVDIWNQMEGDGYQQTRALIALAEGGLFGKGPGCGSLFRVYAMETDIVFSTICEEWGFIVGLLSIGILLAMMLVPMINKPRSYFHTTMILGVVAAIVVQMGLNIFGSCNLIPFTGVTIPFISAGGSSMLTSGMLIGMLKAGQSPVFRKPQPKPDRRAASRSEVRR